jgi:hypothetical protein
MALQELDEALTDAARGAEDRNWNFLRWHRDLSSFLYLLSVAAGPVPAQKGGSGSAHRLDYPT